MEKDEKDAERCLTGKLLGKMVYKNIDWKILYPCTHISSSAKSDPWWRDWMTFGKTVLCQKDPAKGSAVDNYRPISCLPLMWKLMTGMFAEKMYSYLERENVLPSEQKGCCKGSRGTKEQLLIDKMVL